MQERAKITKERILKTAVKLFSEYGFHGTRVDAIAAAAEVNKQRIYAYFTNKETLFQAALSQVFEEISLFSAKTINIAVNEPENLTLLLFVDFMNLNDKYPYFWRMLAHANLNENISSDFLCGIKFEHNKIIQKAFALGQAKSCIKKNISFTTYLFTIMAVAFFYHSNRKTLAKTFSSEIYTKSGREQLMKQLISLF